MSHRAHRKVLLKAAAGSVEVRDRLLAALRVEITDLEARRAVPLAEAATRAERREHLGLTQKLAALTSQVAELAALRPGLLRGLLADFRTAGGWEGPVLFVLHPDAVPGVAHEADAGGYLLQPDPSCPPDQVHVLARGAD